MTFTRELFLQSMDEWGRYPAAYLALTDEERAGVLESNGYACLRDLLAHVAVWWEEARGIIASAIKGGDKPARKYDFAAFNAASVRRFADTPEAIFLVWFEAERQRMTKLVSGLTDEQLHIPRVQSWLDGVILNHLKEHGIGAPRFLVIDTLQREWGGYADRFTDLTSDRQEDFLRRQGFAAFRDLAAHIIAWWEQGIDVIEKASPDDPCEVEDVDVFNAAAVERFRSLQEAEVLKQFDQTRLTLCSLVDMLPDELLARPNVRGWLRADVIEHFFEHAL